MRMWRMVVGNLIAFASLSSMVNVVFHGIRGNCTLGELRHVSAPKMFNDKLCVLEVAKFVGSLLARENSESVLAALQLQHK